MMMLMKFRKVYADDDADLVLVEQYIETQMILLQELWWVGALHAQRTR